MINMVGIRITIQLCLVVLFLGQFVLAGNELREIDHKSLKESALALCESTDSLKILIHFSNLSRIKAFLMTTSVPRLMDCWSRYGDAIKLAERMIKTSTDNICSDEKISLIEAFHHKYISMNPRHLNNRVSSQQTAPLILKNFFVLYAQTIGRNCVNVVTMNLKELSARDQQVAGMIERRERMPFDDLLDKFSRSFSFELSADRQKYMFLLWSLVEDLAYESKDSIDFSKYVDLAADLRPGQVYRVTVKMSSTGPIRSLQDYCRQHLQPSYSKTVLPVLRLTNLGYYLTGFGQIPPRWYKATQLCETILPIRFVTDDSLAEGQVVLVPKEEVDRDDGKISYPDYGPKPKFAYNYLNSPSLWWDITRSNVDQLWTDIRNRKNVMRRYLSTISSKASTVRDENGGGFFLALKKSEGGGRQDFSQALGESLAEINEATSGERRRERFSKFGQGLFSGIKKAGQLVKLVLMGALRIVGCILAIIGMLIIPDFSANSPRSMFINTAMEGGGGGEGSLNLAVMAVPAIG